VKHTGDDGTNKDGRFLVVEMNDPQIMSNSCKIDCIDAGFIFCPNANYSGGNCCTKEEFANGECPRAEFCSNDNPRAPNIFKYLTCPNE
jgi:hypothetical protein